MPERAAIGTRARPPARWPQGYSSGNRHPDFSLPGGLSEEQLSNLLAFLNQPGMQADSVFEHIYATEQPVVYVLRADADDARGNRYYEHYCAGCHGAGSVDAQVPAQHRRLAEAEVLMQYLGG